MEKLSGPLMVFDVESRGLHGEGFAVGWVVINRAGFEVENGTLVAPIDSAQGGDARDIDWVSRNVLPALPDPNASSPREIRTRFWSAWRCWADKGATLFAECGWPVEARFLARCIDDDPAERHWKGPYPLHEVASFEDAAGIRKAEVPRLVSELPIHNPLADARMSARMLLRALDKLGR